jgi:glycosyltransferase involved in cell wall biosynthesis
MASSLAILPSVCATEAEGFVRLPRKFVEGASLFARLWTGQTTVMVERGTSGAASLDDANFRLEDLPFRLQFIDFDHLHEDETARSVLRQSVTMAALHYRQLGVVDLCRSLGSPCVYVTEYSLRTTLQILRAEQPNWLRALKPAIWLVLNHLRERRAIRAAAGAQCNGTPTHDIFKHLNPRSLLYFDTRVEQNMVVPLAALEQRLAGLAERPRLRLMFSGRLVPMKGADQLVPVARKLNELGVPFEMTIAGAGSSKDEIEAGIREHGLTDQVRCVGVLDFKTELVPLTQNAVDLFVCCHPQGDPSCTYLETMSCGVPIVGYHNEAFSGVVAASGVGWLTPMRDPDAMAHKIADLWARRSVLADAALRSREFALQHTFEREFSRRIDHLQALATGAEPALNWSSS